LLHLLSQSPDATTAQVTAIDELSGEHKFDLVLPPSRETFISRAKDGAQSPCPTASRSGARTFVSGLFGNTDGYTYLAFTESARTLAVRDCSDLATVSSGLRLLSRYDNLVLWQVHPDGTYRTTIVEGSDTLTGSAGMAVPTGAVIPDGFDGVLLSVRVPRDLRNAGPNGTADEFVYRIDPDGNVIYKFPLPKYAGSLHDGMVLGHGGRVAFASRGGVLIAFEVESGKELWRWDSDTLSISVFAALANGDCLVQTPTALVEVKDSTDARELMKGKFMVDSQGRLYNKDN
jgi:outer membrane protein assembly factor BamB